MGRHNLFTSSSKEIGIFILKLILLLGLMAGFFFYLSPQYSENYTASLVDKVRRLESIEGPKLVLIGNSNVAFGIKSEEIEQAIGMPVVNMGLHDGLGNVFHEQMAKLNVQPGDIYVIAHTNYADDGTIGADLAWIAMEKHFDLWRLLRREDLLPMLRAYPAYLKGCLSLWVDGTGNQPRDDVYRRDAFNEYGDIVWEDHGLEFIFEEGTVPPPAISDDVVERLNELNQYLTDRGATMLIAGFPIADTPLGPEKPVYEAFEAELNAKMDAPVISDFDEYVFPESYFFNTGFHLNNVGKEARTRQLICDLERYLAE